MYYPHFILSTENLHYIVLHLGSRGREITFLMNSNRIKISAQRGKVDWKNLTVRFFCYIGAKLAWEANFSLRIVSKTNIL